MPCNCEACATREANKVIDVRGHKMRRCDACAGPIPFYKDMGGGGFESPLVDHEYSGDVEGKSAAYPVNLELCYPCYCEAFRAACPGQEPPKIRNAELATMPA